MARLNTKTIWLITAAVAALILALQFCPANRRPGALTMQAQGGSLTLDVADSPERRLFALGMLTRFRPGQAVLLVFDDGTPPRIWSKTLQVEADLIWLDETRQVVDRHLGARPCADEPCPVYAPGRGAVSVVLLSPGAGQGTEFSIGQTAFLKPAPSRP